MAMSEGRSFNILMFLTTAFLCGMIVRSLDLCIYDTEPHAAVAYGAAIVPQVVPEGCVGTEGPVLGSDLFGNPYVTGTRTEEDCTEYQTIAATVTARGYDYLGTCEGVNRDDGGVGDSVCTTGTAADDDCRSVLHDQFPSVSSRRLSDDTPEVRQLRSGHVRDGMDCRNAYVPWVVVTFPDPVATANMLTRCSYRMGTKLSSETENWADVVAQPVVGQPQGIWYVNGTDQPYCAVGSADRHSFLAYAASSRKPEFGIDPLLHLFAFVGLCMCAMCLKTLIMGKDEEPDGEGGDKEGKEGDEDGSSE